MLYSCILKVIAQNLVPVISPKLNADCTYLIPRPLQYGNEANDGLTFAAVYLCTTERSWQLCAVGRQEMVNTHSWDNSLFPGIPFLLHSFSSKVKYTEWERTQGQDYLTLHSSPFCIKPCVADSLPSTKAWEWSRLIYATDLVPILVKRVWLETLTTYTTQQLNRVHIKLEQECQGAQFQIIICTIFSAAVFSINLDPCPGLPGQVTVNPSEVM